MYILHIYIFYILLRYVFYACIVCHVCYWFVEVYNIIDFSVLILVLPSTKVCSLLLIILLGVITKHFDTKFSIMHF